MAVFENSLNGHRVETSAGDVVAAMFLGPLWLLFRGAVGAGLGLLALSAVLWFSLQWLGLLVAVVTNACAALPALRAEFLGRGWKLVETAAAGSEGLSDLRSELPQLRGLAAGAVFLAVFFVLGLGVLHAVTGQSSLGRGQQLAPQGLGESWSGPWPFTVGAVQLTCVDDAVSVRAFERGAWSLPYGLNIPGRAAHRPADAILQTGTGPRDLHPWIDAGLRLCRDGEDPVIHRRGR